jgi:hypothetical protein
LTAFLVTFLALAMAFFAFFVFLAATFLAF